MMINKDLPLHDKIEKTRSTDKQKRLFSQEEVDNIIRKRLARVKQDQEEDQEEEAAADSQEAPQEGTESPEEAVVEEATEESADSEIDALRAENESLKAELENRQKLQDLIDLADQLMKNDPQIPELSVYPKEVYQPLIDFTDEGTVRKSIDALVNFIVWTVEAGKSGELFNPSIMGVSVEGLIKDAFKRPETR